jgi:PHD/YefM family antitoxin component YafN of YafNO toxin-antitoxin module
MTRGFAARAYVLHAEDWVKVSAQEATKIERGLGAAVAVSRARDELAEKQI